MRLRVSPRPPRRLIDIGVLCTAGFGIAWVIGFLQTPAPFGDDAFFNVGEIKSLASNFPFLAWDPRLFAGYVPITGLSWLAYLPPALLVKSGLDAKSSFHVAFVFAFLLFGLSVYYFARSVGSDRIVAFSTSILAWSTNAYWNLTIWGGAYDRAFTIPLMFIALGITYRYASRLNSEQKPEPIYWICLSSWTLLYLGDVYVAVTGTALGSIFLFLSAGRSNLVSGVKRIGAVFLPPILLTLWQTVPLLLQALALGPYTNHNTVPNDETLLFIPGSTWVPTLNLVYIPLILSLALACLLVKARLSSTQRAFLISLFAVGTYWLVMGWFPPLWQYLPRLMATDSSVENLAWVFLMALPILFATLRMRLTGTDDFVLRMGQQFSFHLNRSRLGILLRTATLLVIAANALILIPTVKPVNWAPLSDHLNAGLNSSLGTASNDYRVSLQNRFLTSPFPYYQPDRSETGGRAGSLNPSPLFESWYSTDVFYKNDISSIKTLYVDDRPAANVSSFLESPRNFAGEGFWLDWYATNAIIFDDYASGQTIGNYSARPYSFNVTTTAPYVFTIPAASATYSFPEVIVKPRNSTAILTATNATIVGFYSASRNPDSEYDSLISLLASMGLGPSYTVPLYLHSIQDATAASIDVLVTDSYTYTQYTPQMQMLLQTFSIVVISSNDGPQGSLPLISQQGNRMLVNIPLSFSQLVNNREEGSYYFVKSAPVVEMNTFNASQPTYQGPTNTTISPNSWTAAYRTTNAQGTIQTTMNTLTLNLTSTDATQRSQFNIQSHLSSPVPLSSNLTISFSIQTTRDITLGIIFTPPTACCPNYVELDQKILNGNPVQIHIPYSMFNEWANRTTLFGITGGLTLAVNLPPGYANATVRLANVSLSSPAYTVFTLPKPISPASDGILIHDPGITGVGLLNGSNASTTILNIPSNMAQTITTIGSFSGGTASEQYDRIITFGGDGRTGPTVALFSQPASMPVHEEWQTEQNMIATSIPQGYRGLVWKETYSQLWRFDPQSGPNIGPLTYFYAGPGMIYIPSSDYTSVRASFMSTTLESVVLFSIPSATVALLLVLRNWFPDPRRRQKFTAIEKVTTSFVA